ncbi:RNA polymerase sigma factor [Singulisphaera sp. PoT]|uniref:RNA polymerase sigma factor n=1 Tax=Singulisphaera sp. PoT TaxID=3411797 RepID=UPI003BF4D2E4
MVRASSAAVLREIDTLFRVGVDEGAADRSLVEGFLRGTGLEAEEAFARLVERHAPMVWRTCRQILGNAHDADDAFQATFLVLARKAGTIRDAGSVAGWLHGVAGRVAARARVDGAMRRVHELRHGEGNAKRVEDSPTHEGWAELHEEIDRLPERFRLPIVLFHLEGLSYEQAAGRIGCPVRTVQSRLTRGRERLRRRLARRGFGPAVALLASILGSADVSRACSLSLAQAALRFSHQTHAIAGESTSAVALAEGVIQAMIVSKLKWLALGSIMFATAASGFVTLAASGASEPPASPAADNSAKSYSATLTDGTKVEVVAISNGSGSWWRPDGSPLDEGPGEISLPPLREVPGREARAIIVRMSGTLETTNLKWLPQEAEDYWGGTPTKGGKPIPGLSVYLASLPSNRKTCAVEFRIAAGAWKLEANNDGKGGTSFSAGSHKFYFGKAREYRGGTAIAIAQNIVGQDLRVVAIGPEGATYPATYSSGGGETTLSLLDAEFSLPPGQIREYMVQSRPFERKIIADIAFQPRATSNLGER